MLVAGVEDSSWILSINTERVFANDQAQVKQKKNAQGQALGVGATQYHRLHPTLQIALHLISP